MLYVRIISEFIYILILNIQQIKGSKRFSSNPESQVLEICFALVPNPFLEFQGWKVCDDEVKFWWLQWCIHACEKGITNTGPGVDKAARQSDERNKQVIFKICATFTDCTSEINNMQIDNAIDLDVVIPMYNLIKYSDNNSKTSGNLWSYCRGKPNPTKTDSDSFKFKARTTWGTTNDRNTKKYWNSCATKMLKKF